MKSAALPALLVAVLAASCVHALTNDVLTNGRRLADGSFTPAAMLNPVVIIPSNLTPLKKNCFIDSGPRDSSTVASGYSYVHHGINMCCREAGTLQVQNAALMGVECAYNDEITNLASTSQHFIATRLTPGNPCLVDCFGMGGCDKCLGPFKITCDEICRGKGWDSGRCGFPNSVDPNRCCECANLNGSGTVLEASIFSG